MLLLAIITINHACNKKTNHRDKKNHTEDNDSAIIKIAEMTIKSYIDMKGLVRKQLVLFNPDKVVLECFSDGYFPKKIDIKSVVQGEDGTSHLFTETFYFGDDNGYPLIYTYQSEDGETSIQVIAKNRAVVSYITHHNNIIYVNKLDSFTKETKISALMFILASNILHLDNVNFEVIQKPSLNSMPVITTLKDNVVMYEKPDTSSNKINNLKEGELLFFLDYSNKLDSINSQAFPWFKVSTEDKKTIGWIMGHFDNIKYYTDGD